MHDHEPLVGRPADAILFRTERRSIDAQTFQHHAVRTAARLGPGAHVIVACKDRYRFTVALAAAVLGRRTALLASDSAPNGVAGLSERYPQASLLTDTEVGDPPDRGGDPIADPERLWIPRDHVAALVFTSGSTGNPVAHEKRWGALVQRSVAAAEQFVFAADAPVEVVGTVPPYHMYGFETTVLLPLHAPAASWSGPGFYPEDVAAALQRGTGPGVLVTTPLHLRALANGLGERIRPACVISATAPLGADLAGEVEVLWSTRVLEIFGATEVGSIASRRTVEGDVWRAYPDVAIEQSGDADGVLVSAPHAHDHPLADAIDIVAPGRFRLLGRQTDMIKIGGRRASLAGLDAILNATPGVVDGAFLAPDDLDSRPSARLQVFVVSDGTGGPAILARLRERIEPVFLPRQVTIVDALPRNAVGKLPRAALAGLVPGGEATERAQEEFVGRFTIPPEHPVLAGHFPNRPLVPGALLLDHALALLGAARGLPIASLGTVKFLVPVAPGQTIDLFRRATGPLRIAFTCRHGEVDVVAGTAVLGEPT